MIKDYMKNLISRKKILALLLAICMLVVMNTEWGTLIGAGISAEVHATEYSSSAAPFAFDIKQGDILYPGCTLVNNDTAYTMKIYPDGGSMVSVGTDSNYTVPSTIGGVSATQWKVTAYTNPSTNGQKFFMFSLSPLTSKTAYFYSANTSMGYVSPSSATWNSGFGNSTAYPYSGYHFTYWNGLSTDYSQTISANASGTWYANFAANNYTVYYNGNGGALSSGVTSHYVTKTYGDTFSLNTNSFIRKGYSFKGWNTSQSNANNGTIAYSDGQRVSNLTSTNGGTVTLYACWTPHTNVITIDKNEMNRDKYHTTYITGIPTSATYDKVVTVPVPTCGGYKFIGWQVSGYDTTTACYSTTSASSLTTKLNSTNGKINATGTVYLKNLNPEENANITLKALWEPATYNITYRDKGNTVYSGDTNLSGSMTYKYGENQNAKVLPTVTKDGYYFVGWFTDEACAGAASCVTQIESTEFGDKTYYARWSQYPLSLQNGSFEKPVNTSFFRQYYNETPEIWWKTSATDKKIEIGSVSGGYANSAYSAYHTRVAADGVQFAELNATQIGALYQNIATIPSEDLFWGLEHRGRKGDDTMQVWIGSPEEIEMALAQYAQAGNKVSGVDESLLNKIAQKPTGQSSADIKDSNDSWGAYQGSYKVPAGQDDTTFAFVSINASGNDKSIGNLLDNIYFTKVSPTAATKALNIYATNGGSMQVTYNGTTQNIGKGIGYNAQVVEGSTFSVSTITPEAGYTNNGGFINGKYISEMPTTFSYDSMKKSMEIVYLFSEDGSVYVQKGEGTYTDDKLIDGATVLKATGGNDTYILGTATHSYKTFAGWKIEGVETTELPAAGSIIKYVTENNDENITTYLVVYNPSGTEIGRVPSSAGIILTAQYTDKAVFDQKIILDANGGTFEDSSIRYNEDGTSEVILDSVDSSYTVKNPSRVGYTFQGWKYTDSILVKSGDVLAYSLTDDYNTQIAFGNREPILMEDDGRTIRLTAVWTANTYTVTYKANGGTGSMNAQELSYGEIETLSANTFQRLDYQFLGWSRSESAISATYIDKESGTLNMSGTNGGKVTLYAVWQKDTAYPTSLQNGSFETPATTQWTCKYNDKNSYKAIGWYTSASDHKVEIGNPTKNQTASMSAYHTAVASEGKQFAELNANQVGALYQYVSTDEGETLYWGLDHRGRYGKDTMQLWIGTPDEITLALQQYTQSGNKVSGVKAQLLDKIACRPDGQATVDIVDDDSKWVTYNGSYQVPKNQGVTAFAFVSVASAEDNKTCGNLLDNVYFSVEKPVQTNQYSIGATVGGTVEVYYDEFKQGEASSTQNVDFTAKYGQNVRLVVNENTNYTYNGAYIDGKYYTVEQVNSFLNNLLWTVGNPAQNLDMTFLFSADSTIMFASMGGSYETTDNQVEQVNLKARQERSYTILEPKKEHYVFSGWTIMGSDKQLQANDIVKYETDANGKTYLNVYRGNSKVYSVLSQQGINVVAQYELDTSALTTVTFDPNGGYYADTKVVFDGTQDYVLQTPSRGGFMCQGWSVNGQVVPVGALVTFDWDASGKQVLTFTKEDGSTIAIAGQTAVTIQAQWKKQTYETLLSEDCGNVTGNAAFATDGAGYGQKWTGILTADKGYTLPANIRVKVDGKDYTGFQYNQSTGKISIPENVIYGPVEVTACATENHYHISFAQTSYLSLDGSTTATYDNSYTDYLKVSSGYKLPKALNATMNEEAFTNYDYDSTTGKITINPQIIDGDIIFTGAAEEGIYTLTLDGNGATIQNTSAIYEKYSKGYFKDSNCTKNADKITIPEKEGYNFKGYYTIERGNKTYYIDQDGTLLNNLTPAKFSANVTLYADWELARYNLTSELNNVTIRQGGVARSGIRRSFLQLFSIGDVDGTISYGTEVAFTLIPTEHHELQDSINVEATSGSLVEGKDYSYDKTSGEVVVYGTSIISDINIKAEADLEKLKVEASTGAGGTVKAEVVDTKDDAEIITSIGAEGTSVEGMVEYGAKVRLTAKATAVEEGQSGYTFIGWYKAGVNNAVSSDATIEVTIEDAVQYTAVFGKDLTVILDANGGEFASKIENTKEISYGQSWDLPVKSIDGLLLNPNLPTRPGYTFEGWKVVYLSQPDDTGLTETATDSGYYSAIQNNYEPNEEGNDGIFTATLRTDWTANSGIEVSYQNVNENEISDEYSTYTTGKGFKLSDNSYSLRLPILARTGYVFEGWYTAETDGHRVTALSSKDYEEKTYWARFRPIKYTICYNANGGDGAITSQPMEYDATYQLNAVGTHMMRTGYIFDGWTTNADGTGDTYADAQLSIKNLTTKDGEQINLYAKWKAEKFSINYELQDGEIKDASWPTKYTYGEGAQLPTNVVKRGYTFVGWYQNSAGTGTKYENVGLETIGNQTYYAKWVLQNYGITYTNLGDGSVNDTSTARYTFGDYVVLPMDVTRSNWKFLGWYDNAEYSGSQIETIATQDAGDKMLYAKWAKGSLYEAEWIVDGKSYYGTLEEALAVANHTGDSIKVQQYTNLQNNIEIPAGVTLTVAEDTILFVGGGCSLTNNGVIVNNGKLAGDGIYDNNGEISNASGAILAKVDNQDGTIKDGVIKSDGEVTGGDFCGHIINEGTVVAPDNIEGTFDNDGIITVPSGHESTIAGIINNGANKPGTIDNNGTLQINGTLDNGAGNATGVLNNGDGENYAGRINVSDGTGNMHGNVVNGEKGILNNLGTVTDDSVINLNEKGTLENKGETYSNESSLVVAKEADQVTSTGDKPTDLGVELFDAVSSEKQLIAAIARGKTELNIIGTILLTKDFVIDPNIKLTITDKGGLNTNGYKLINKGELINSGTLAGEIDNSGKVINNDGIIGDGENPTVITLSGSGSNEMNGGAIEENAKLTIARISGDVTNKGELTIPTTADGHTEVAGDFTNCGILHLGIGETIFKGELDNEGTLKNDGVITADNEIINSGSIENKDNDAVILAPSINNKGGEIKNGTIGQEPSGTDTGDGIATLVTGGTVSGNIVNNGELKGLIIKDATSITNSDKAIINGCDIPQEILDEEGNVISTGANIRGGILRFRAIFNNGGQGSEIKPEYGLAEGTNVTKPETPVSTGYLFKGWYKDEQYNTLWNFDEDVVSDNIILYAKWTECLHENNTTPPTCTVGHKCSECGKELKALGHNWSNWSVVETATCTSAEVQQRTCNRCKLAESKNGEIAGHDWEEDYTVDQEATETSDGSKSIHCKNCDAVKDSTIIYATGYNQPQLSSSKKNTKKSSKETVINQEDAESKDAITNTTPDLKEQDGNSKESKSAEEQEPFALFNLLATLVALVAAFCAISRKKKVWFLSMAAGVGCTIYYLLTFHFGKVVLFDRHSIVFGAITVLAIVGVGVKVEFQNKKDKL